MLEELLQEERKRAVASAITALPPQQRVALTLRVYHGLSYKEIGETLGCSEGAARVNVFHAVQGLRAKLSRFSEET